MSELKDYLRKLADGTPTAHRNVAHRAVNLGYVLERKSRKAITYTITESGKAFIGWTPPAPQEKTDGKVQAQGHEDVGQGEGQDHAHDEGQGQVLAPAPQEPKPAVKKPAASKKRK